MEYELALGSLDFLGFPNAYFNPDRLLQDQLTTEVSPSGKKTVDFKSHLLHIQVFTAIIVQYDWIFIPIAFNVLDCEHYNFWIPQLASRFSILYFYNATDPNESKKVPWPDSLHLLGSNSCLFGCYDVNLPRRHFQKALRNVFRLV